jgi:hypothetical protein
MVPESVPKSVPKQIRVLRVAGGCALATAVERETGFDFLDHELMYAGSYALAAAEEK